MASDTVPDIGGRDVLKGTTHFDVEEWAAERKRAMERHPTALRSPDQHPVYSETARDEQLMQPTPTPIVTPVVSTSAPIPVSTPHGERKHRIVTCVVFETFCRDDQVGEIQSEVLRHVLLSINARAQAYAPTKTYEQLDGTIMINGGVWTEVQERSFWEKAGVSN